MQLRGRRIAGGTIDDARDVDPEGQWPMRFDPNAPPMGVESEGYDALARGPVHVVLNVFVSDITAIDTVAQLIRPRLQITMDWVDDGLIEYAGGGGDAKYWQGDYRVKDGVVLDAEHVWTPKLDFVNAIAGCEGVKAAIDVVTLRGRPLLQYYVEFYPDLRSPFDLRYFPFDAQRFEIEFTSSFWSAKDVRFLFASAMTERGGASAVGAAVGRFTEWELLRLSVDTRVETYPYLARYDDQAGAYQHATVALFMRRNPHYYLLRVTLVSSLLAFTEATSFLIAPTDLSDRFSVSGTTFLSMIAFYFVTLEQIPRVSILTRCDVWNMLNFSLLFLSLVQNGVVALALRHGWLDERAAHNLDDVSAALYVLGVCASLAWFMWPYREYRRSVGAGLVRKEV